MATTQTSGSETCWGIGVQHAGSVHPVSAPQINQTHTHTLVLPAFQKVPLGDGAALVVRFRSWVDVFLQLVCRGADTCPQAMPPGGFCLSVAGAAEHLRTALWFWDLEHWLLLWKRYEGLAGNHRSKQNL